MWYFWPMHWQSFNSKFLLFHTFPRRYGRAFKTGRCCYIITIANVTITVTSEKPTFPFTFPSTFRCLPVLLSTINLCKSKQASLQYFDPAYPTLPSCSRYHFLHFSPSSTLMNEKLLLTIGGSICCFFFIYYYNFSTFLHFEQNVCLNENWKMNCKSSATNIVHLPAGISRHMNYNLFLYDLKKETSERAEEEGVSSRG